MNLLRMWYRYWRGNTPWDSGIVPPEIVEAAEGREPGRALDLGCGTGTTSVYLAGLGWHTLGVDFVGKAVRMARRKAQQAGVSERARFVNGDVTRLYDISLTPPYDWVIDIGCGHAVPYDKQPDYAESIADVMRPGGLLMIYAHMPGDDRPIGLTPERAQELYTPYFRHLRTVVSDDTASGWRSAWHWFERA